MTPIATAELNESLDQFVSTWRMLARPFPAAEIADKPGFALSWANIPFVFYNTTFLTEPLSDARVLKNRIAEALAHIRSKSSPGWIVVCADQLSGAAREKLAQIAEEAKLTPLPMTGMVGDIVPLPESPRPELRFVRISDDATIADFVDLNCAAYGVPIEAGRSIVKEHTFWRDHAYGFVAYKGDQPMATATAIVNGDCLLLFLVATAADQRRNGYADAVVRRALNAAHQATGIRRTVLHATEMGAPVYLRMGYHATGRFVGYLPQAG